MRSAGKAVSTMTRLAVFLLAAATVVAAVAVPVAGSDPRAPVAPQVGSATPGGPDGSPNASAATAAPGARLAGVVGVQGAEVSAEIESRAFGHRIATAHSNASRAAVLSDELGTAERRLATLRERRRALQSARANGSISDARYRAEVATLAARTRAVGDQLNRTADVSRTLPASVLAARGVNTTAIETLRANARTLTGPEVAAIARSIAGPGAGRGLGVAGNGSTGPPAVAPGRGPGGGGPPSADDGTGAPSVGNVTDATRGDPTAREPPDGTRGPGPRDGGPPDDAAPRGGGGA